MKCTPNFLKDKRIQSFYTSAMLYFCIPATESRIENCEDTFHAQCGRNSYWLQRNIWANLCSKSGTCSIYLEASSREGKLVKSGLTTGTAANYQITQESVPNQKLSTKGYLTNFII